MMQDDDPSRVSNLELSSRVIRMCSFFAFPVIPFRWRREVIRGSAAGVCFSRLEPYSPALPSDIKCKSRILSLECLPWNNFLAMDTDFLF